MRTMPGFAALQIALAAAALWAAPICAADAASTSVRFPSFGEAPVTTIAGQLFRPQGKGPFPGVVLLHGCYGVEPLQRAFAARLATLGFEALVVDSYTPRGLGDLCGGAGQHRRDQAIDARGALEFLRGQGDVDGGRVAVMGWSAGAGATIVSVAQRFVGRRRPGGGGFRAAVAYYPPCDGVHRVEALSAPLLMLLGGADEWHPPKACLDLAEMLNANGASVTAKVYAGAAHGFDNPQAPGRQKAGDRVVTVKYDPAAAADADARAVAFLNDKLRP